MGTEPMLLRTVDLVKRFGALVASNQANVAVRPGELHALIGPNGAGKTTLIHQISGALAPSSGSIWLDGRDITALPMHRRVQLGLVRSYQITSIFARLSVLDNLALAVQARDGSSLRFWRPARQERARYEMAAQVAERVGLGAQLGQTAGLLSHGQQRQLEVGLALALRPRLLLLDEPMAGMGQAESERMVELLRSLRGELALLLIEHDMDAVFQLADRVSVMVLGRVIASDLPARIQANAEVRQAYLGDEIELAGHSPALPTEAAP